MRYARVGKAERSTIALAVLAGGDTFFKCKCGVIIYVIGELGYANPVTGATSGNAKIAHGGFDYTDAWVIPNATHQWDWILKAGRKRWKTWP